MTTGEREVFCVTNRRQCIAKYDDNDYKLRTIQTDGFWVHLEKLTMHGDGPTSMQQCLSVKVCKKPKHHHSLYKTAYFHCSTSSKINRHLHQKTFRFQNNSWFRWNLNCFCCYCLNTDFTRLQAQQEAIAILSKTENTSLNQHHSFE